MESNFDKSYKDFEKSIDFIIPTDVTPENAIKSFVNLKNRDPDESKKKTRYSSSTSGLDSSSKKTQDKNSKTKDEISNTINGDEKDENKNILLKKKNKNKIMNLRFGQHKNFSFFESYAREIIFQIFDYHQMYFFHYTIRKEHLESEKKKEIKNEEDIKSETNDDKHKKEKNINNDIEFIKLEKKENKKNDIKNDYSGKQINNLDKEIKVGEPRKEKNETIEAKDNEKEEKEKNSDNQINDKILKTDDKDEQKEKKLIENLETENKKNKLEIPSDTSSKEGNRSSDKEKMKKYYEKKKPTKDKNLESKDKNSKDEKDITGDIDFMIPDLKSDELKKVLAKKELAPFLFFGNIDQDLNSDLIGEIKENFSTGDKKHIKQFNKCMKIFTLCQKSQHICNQFGLKKENQKILVYIFDGSYKNYLKRMLLYKPLYEKFKDLNKSEKAIEFLELYSKEYKNENDISNDFDFIRNTLNSNIPYIFIFINDLLSIYPLKKNSEEIKLKNSALLESQNINNEIEEDKNRKQNIEKKDIYILLNEIKGKQDCSLIIISILLFLILISNIIFFIYK